MRNTLFSTYLHDLLSARRVTAEHVACELDHADTAIVEGWLSGWSIPDATELQRLAAVLHTDPVVLTTGWLIAKYPHLEERLWRDVLGPLATTFPKSDDLTLRMMRPRRDMTVGDPHDEQPEEGPITMAALRKRSVAARGSVGSPSSGEK